MIEMKKKKELHEIGYDRMWRTEYIWKKRKIKKIGNSLGFTIPKKYMDECKLNKMDEVEMMMTPWRIIINGKINTERKIKRHVIKTGNKKNTRKMTIPNALLEMFGFDEGDGLFCYMHNGNIVFDRINPFWREHSKLEDMDMDGFWKGEMDGEMVRKANELIGKMRT